MAETLYEHHASGVKRSEEELRRILTYYMKSPSVKNGPDPVRHMIVRDGAWQMIKARQWTDHRLRRWEMLVDGNDIKSDIELDQAISEFEAVLDKSE